MNFSCFLRISLSIAFEMQSASLTANGHSKSTSVYLLGKYDEWSPYEHHAEPSLQYFSPVPECRHLHQRNAPHQPLIPMYAPDLACSYPLVHQVTPPTTYYPDMSLQRQNLPRESRSQLAQPPPDVFQQRLETEARRNIQEYFTRADDFSIQRGYRGRSRSNVSQLVIQRSDQGSQYSDSDVQKLIRRKRFEVLYLLIKRSQ